MPGFCSTSVPLEPMEKPVLLRKFNSEMSLLLRPHPEVLRVGGHEGQETEDSLPEREDRHGAHPVEHTTTLFEHNGHC